MADQSSLLKIISEKLVKPSSPTPSSSRYYKVNFIDAFFAHSLLINVAFFYPKGIIHGGNSSRKEELFELLETSLSKTLTYYYPFAGRFMDDNITVDCNDAGLQLWHVQIQGTMSEILDNRVEYQPWNLVFLPEKDRCVISHVMIQLSYFECGEICIIIYFSHKLGDGSTLANFVNDWAIIVRGEQDVSPPAPILSGASIYPPPTYPFNAPVYATSSKNLVTQRFVFSASSISELKRKVVTETELKNPTQVEVISALIFERLNLLLNSFKPSTLMQMVNIRQNSIPPLPEQTVGNFIDKFMINVTNEKEMTFSRIVVELRKCRMEYMNKYTGRLEGNEFANRITQSWIEYGKKLKENNFDVYPFSSWFRIPFYEIDFGFGKPIFVCQPIGVIPRTTVLMANPSGDGIDAFVTLNQDQMLIFECDEKLLAFASLNPRICTKS